VIDRMKSNCHRVVGMYNSCIDGDNILYPHSNYRKCFSEYNALYVCSYIKKYDKKEKDICSNFVLPSIAYSNLKKSLFGSIPEEYCEGYENKIIKNYDKHINEIGEKQEELEKKLQHIELVFKHNKELLVVSNALLSQLVSFNKIWVKFFEIFEETYKKRESLYQKEFVILQRLRNAFDRFYPFSAQLNGLTQDKKFLSSDFSSLFETIQAYYNKAIDQIEIVKKIIEDYTVLLKKEEKERIKKEKLKIEKEVKEEKERLQKYQISMTSGNKTQVESGISSVESKKIEEDTLMVSQKIEKIEVNSFQNQYVSVQLYIKNFLNYCVKTIRLTNSKCEKDKFNSMEEINRIKIMIGFITKQKQRLFEYILE